jgi:hypothetical protein
MKVCIFGVMSGAGNCLRLLEGLNQGLFGRKRFGTSGLIRNSTQTGFRLQRLSPQN